MRNLILSSLFVLLAGFLHGQSDTLTRQEFVGNWSAYMISDKQAYGEIPDSLKNGKTVVDVSYELYPTYEIYSDGTLKMHGDYMEGDTIKGSWKLERDTLIAYDAGRNKTERCKIRCISQGHIEVIFTEDRNGELISYIYYWEKAPGITRADLFPDSMTGKWKACLIKDTAAYHALPDWKRNFAVVNGMSGMPPYTYEFREDGTMNVYAQFSGVSVNGTWYMMNDSLFITQPYGNTTYTSVFHVRFLDDERMEWATTAYDEDKSATKTQYYFVESK